MIRSFLLRLFFTIPILAISLACYSNQLRSPDSVEVVLKDTIHLRGKIVDEKGMPLKGIAISTGCYFCSLVYTTSNAEGDYLLKNVQPNDTIFFRSSNRLAKIYPEGSRILNIVLREEIREHWVRPTVIAKRDRPREVKNSTVKYDNSPLFITYDISPEIIGGMSKLDKELKTKLNYPEKARKANIEGTVKIEFVVDPTGKPIDFKTVQGLGYGCEDAVIEVLKGIKWRPGVSNGRALPITTSVKVLFKLEDS